MRTAFIEELVRLARTDERIWLLTGDLGFSVLEPFASSFPKRFINVGVAEQNMIGIAAGLAMTGKVVFTYSIGNFATLRCLEQIRNDVCYHNLPVISVAVGGGLAYGSLGYSHHAIEDLAIMRALPGMRVVAPGDPLETRAAVQYLVENPGPGYLRLGKANEPTVHAIRPNISADRFLIVRPGNDVSILTTGGVLTLGVAAADELQKHGVQAEVLSLPVINPLSESTVVALAGRTGRIVTVEEHTSGGLGAAIAERLCNLNSLAQLNTITLQSGPSGLAGDQQSLREALGVSKERVVSAGLRLMQGRNRAAA